ncbi:hypothetical protein [Janibacter alittae]|uniref:Rhomboid family intramembrane serine protease n=1 Tax=Janibacter alittae TaxID=3115209 RepID=A0ABZ2MJN2_9MICO
MSLLVQLSTWVVFAAVWAGLREEERLQRPRWGILALWCVVAIPSLLQFVLPGMLESGQRESAAILAGQWWRLVTSMVLQDGGWYGTAFNLATLAFTLILVQPVLRTRVVAALLVTGGVVGNVLTVLTFGDAGAGNSMATMFLAVTALALAPERGPRRLVAFGVVVAVTVVKLALADIHGLALAAALVVAAALALVARAR